MVFFVLFVFGLFIVFSLLRLSALLMLWYKVTFRRSVCQPFSKKFFVSAPFLLGFYICVLYCVYVFCIAPEGSGGIL